MVLYRRYQNLKAVVKWRGKYSCEFIISRGTRQGSIVPPCLFNVFINGLLLQLNVIEVGLKVGETTYTSFAYADGITVFSSTVSGLQKLIDLCEEYSRAWRLNFISQKLSA